MPSFVGLDASKRTTSICVIDKSGEVVKEGVVETEPKAIIAFLRGEGRRYSRVGMEAWSMSPWLYAGLAKAGLPIICIEAWHASGILKASRRNKTDRNDARGIAEIMRMGSFKVVHIKTLESQRIRDLLTMRKFLRTKVTDIENAIRSAALTRGIRFASGRQSTFDGKVRKALCADLFALELIQPLLSIRAIALREMIAFETRLLTIAKTDPVCRRLMTAPGIGPITALNYRVAIDEPARFSRSRDVGAHLGLTPRTRQSGQSDFRGSISRSGDNAVRAALYLAAFGQLRASTKPSSLKTWGEAIAARRGRKKAVVAMARRLAVILHRVWITETDFHWPAAADLADAEELDQRPAAKREEEFGSCQAA